MSYYSALTFLIALVIQIVFSPTWLSANTYYQGKTIRVIHGRDPGGSGDLRVTTTPKDRLEIIKEAMRKTLSDRAFYKEYYKLVGEEPTPLLPDANEKAIREIPRDAETIGLFKRFVGPGPLPPR